MSITVRKTFSVNTVPTDVTGATLGIVRTDTNAVVVAAGTAMTHDSTGVYSYSFDEPVAGLTYTISYVFTYGGHTTAWSENVTGSVEETIPLPTLTGDYLTDSLNSLIVERMRVCRAGPKVSYSLHGHAVDWTKYLDSLDRRVMALRREIAMANPFESVGIGF